MKYKVGDKVRIVSKWKKGCNQDPEGRMDKWLGKVMTIILVSECQRAYKMREDKMAQSGFGWLWNENCIAGLACEKKIVITSDGKKTLARLYDGKKVVKTATAKCSPDDKFDFEAGAKYAFDRLLNKDEKKEEPKYYSGKVVCVEKSCCGYIPFTVGKIYTVSNGTITGDDGWEAAKIEDIQDTRTRLCCTFIEIVE